MKKTTKATKTTTKEPEIRQQIDLPPQPMPVKKNIWGKLAKTDETVPAIVVKTTGIYLEHLKEAELPVNAKLWTYEDQYVYSLVLKDGKYQLFEPTGESNQLPDKLWRAIRAVPIRNVFTHKNRGMEKVKMGLGLTFVLVCIFTLFVLGNMIAGQGA